MRDLTPHRHTLLKSEIPHSGLDLEVDATAFVPTLPSGERWPDPNFLGLSGFLERIRFAIDPAENAFYFGTA